MLWGIIIEFLTGGVGRALEKIKFEGDTIVFLSLFLLGILGIVMHIYGVYKFSIKVNDTKMKTNVVIYAIFRLIGFLFMLFIFMFYEVLRIALADAVGDFYLLALFGLLALGIILFVISYYFMGEYLIGIYQYTSIKLFEECGRFMKWGVFTIVILIGALLIAISYLGSIFAFAKLPNTLDIKQT